MYKKILLSSAIAAALGTAGVAQAAVDLDKPTGENPLVFAEEIALGAGVNLDVTAAGIAGGGSSAAAAAVEVSFGFTIGQGTSKYVRLTFDEALGAALEPLDFADDSAAAATYSISQGGAAGDTYVIVEVSAPTGGSDVLSTEHFQFVPATGDEIVATTKNTRSISYDLYETAVDAVNETNVLVAKSGQWITWGPGYSLSCTSANPDRIDVVNPTQFLGSGATTNVSNVSLTALTVFTEAGVLVTIPANYFGAGALVDVDGSTEAFEVANGITLSTVNATTQPLNGTAQWVAMADPAAEFNGVFAVNADTVNDMVPSSYTISVTDAGAATYDVGTITASCGSLQYSGSTDRLDLALTPGGAFKQFARITNPSATDGAVTVTVFNDAGDSVTFPMGDIAGVANVLEARGSTKLININDIYAAAQAADPAFALAATGADSRNKLRVEVRGEFGDDALEDTTVNGNRLVERRVDGIYIQGLTVARDNNAFFQTK